MDRSWNVLDLFSGAGGMSFGFRAHSAFRIVGAIDAQHGKPSAGRGSLECNKTYAANIGLQPLEADVSAISELELREYLSRASATERVDVLISCAPCTGFSRTIRRNLVENDSRNSLVVRSADFVRWLKPKLFVMENVGELLLGKFTYHFQRLKEELEAMNYTVKAEVHSLDEFGLPQRRRRALVVAAKAPLPAFGLGDLWHGYRVTTNATTVRRAIASLPSVEAGGAHPTDANHTSPSFTPLGLRRLQSIPADGGSWPDLLRHVSGDKLLIPSMLRYATQGRVGPYRDVYGRMAWDQPSVTIKRECAHTGNGRYAHPVQDRLCTVREMAILQGFPRNFRFVADSLSNMYRHVGDAVPPLISHQIAWACSWMLTGKRPEINEIILPDTHLRIEDIEVAEEPGAEEQLNLLEGVVRFAGTSHSDALAGKS